MKKKYYSLSELSRIFNIKTADFFHLILMNSSNLAYIFLDSKDIPYLRKTGVFLQIPNENIQHMEIYALNFGSVFQIEISFLFIIKEEENWPQFLNLDEKDLSKYVSAEKIKEFEDFQRHMPSYYKDLTPIERFRNNVTKKIDKSVSDAQIFVKSDSELVITLFEAATNSKIPPHLDPNNPTCTERMQLLHIILKRLNDPDIKAIKSHALAVEKIVNENGYDYKIGDKQIQDYAYVTASIKENKKHPLKKINNPEKKSIKIKDL